MNPSRREFLKGAGALVVFFSAGPLARAAAGAQGQFASHSSHIDPEKLDSWVAVNGDGIITAYTGKCDLGQGMFTAQTQLVAEELCVALGRVKLIQCDTSMTPDQGSTSGSQSTPTNFNDENLALAAATAREALLNMAAARFSQPIDSLTVVDGVIAAKTGQRVRYEELIGSKHFHLPLNSAAKRRAPSEWTVLGKPVASLDRVALVTGRFEFVQAVRVDGMLHGRVVRPPTMGASLIRVDESSVRDIPGVVKIVVRKNFVGVVAERQHQAIRAARQLRVEWRQGPELPAQESFFEHLRRQPSRDKLAVDSGNVETHLGRGRLLRATYKYPYQMHGSLGTSCAVADVRSDGATVWSGTQSVYPTRSIVAMLLKLPVERVRVVFVRGSGCYGLNGADAASFEAAMLSQAVMRPVRLQFSREDEMKWENLGSACVIDQRAALSMGGRIIGWDRENWVASLGNRPGYDQPGNVISGMLVGYEPELFEPTPAKQPESKLRNGSNTVPNYMAGCVEGTCTGTGTVQSERVLTHTVLSPFFTGPLRSPLRIQNTFANECFMDELCVAAGADPIQFRIAHLQHPRLIGVLKAVEQAAGWKRRVPGAQAATGKMATGRGVACVAYEGENGYVALVAEVEVDTETGAVHPTRFVIANDCGPISNPDGLRNQLEGGLLQGMSRTLVEEITWDSERITSVDWETYPSLRLDYKIPSIECVFVTPANVRATGAGETAITVTPAAIGNAIFDATGARLREVPFTPERVQAALHERRTGRSVV